jgi:hypothetical protein
MIETLFNFKRSVLLIVSAGIAYGSPISAQPAEVKSHAPARVSVDGKFSRYLESPSGDIDGLELEDGTVGRFAPVKRGAQAELFRPGDSVRVEGDAVSGLTRGYIVRALMTRNSVPTTRGAIPPRPSTGVSATDSRPRGAGKPGRSSVKGGAQPLRSAGKSRSPAADRSRRVDNVLVVDSTSVRARKRSRLEAVGAKAREVTTGKDKGGDYSRWRRSQENAGP